MASASSNASRPTVRFMLAHPLRWVALGFGSGLSPIMPGTVGSFSAWGIFAYLATVWPAQWPWWAIAVVLVASFGLGVLACSHTGKALGVSDHGGMVWDEFVAVWLVLAMLPTGFWWALSGVVLFRIFDIAKPQPVRYFDTKWKNGFGVMFDDLVAAGYTLLTLALFKRLFA
jgi:phosphatidylglycerophosphatase A